MATIRIRRVFKVTDRGKRSNALAVAASEATKEKLSGFTGSSTREDRLRAAFECWPLVEPALRAVEPFIQSAARWAHDPGHGDGIEDIEQDLWIHMACVVSLYNAELSSWSSFTRTCCRRFASNIRRRAREKFQGGHRIEEVADYPEDGEDRQEEEEISRSGSEKIAAALVQINPREREIISLRYGLGGREQMTLEEAGARLGVSKERIRQIQVSATQKIRTLVQADRP